MNVSWLLRIPGDGQVNCKHQVMSWKPVPYTDGSEADYRARTYSRDGSRAQYMAGLDAQVTLSHLQRSPFFAHIHPPNISPLACFWNLCFSFICEQQWGIMGKKCWLGWNEFRHNWRVTPQALFLISSIHKGSDKPHEKSPAWEITVSLAHKMEPSTFKIRPGLGLFFHYS